MAGEKEYQQAQLELSKSSFDMGVVLNFLTLSAKLEYPPAFIWLHILYTSPYFDTYDIASANKWKKCILTEKSIKFISEQAFKENDPHAKFLYGYLCHHGLGVKRDLPMAITNYHENEFTQNQTFARHLRADAFFLVGKNQYSAGKFSDAKNKFRIAEKLNKDFVSAYLWHGKALVRMAETQKSKGLIRGDNGSDQLYTKALSCYRICLSYNKKDAELHCAIGQIYGNLEQYKSALTYLENACAIDSENMFYQEELASLKLLSAKNVKLNPVKQIKAQEDKKCTRLITPAPIEKKHKNPSLSGSSLPDDKKSVTFNSTDTSSFYHFTPHLEEGGDHFFYDTDGALFSTITEQRIPSEKYLLIFACRIVDAELNWDSSTILFMEGMDSAKKGFIYQLRCSSLTNDDGNFIVEYDQVTPSKFRKNQYRMYFLRTHLNYIDKADGETLLQKAKSEEFSYSEGLSLKGSIAQFQFNHFQACRQFLKSIHSLNIILPKENELPVALAVESKSSCIIL